MCGRAGPTARGTTHWSADTGAMVFSATKGMASTVIHRLADRGLIDYEAPVAEYWPEFGANGKADITVREVMRHRAGLSQLNGASRADLMDHVKMEERLAAAPVNRVLYGKGAYHALTYGWLMSGLARAVTGKGMRRADPRGTGRAAQHRRPAPGSPARRGADQGRADHHPAGRRQERGARQPSCRSLPRCNGPAASVRCTSPRCSRLCRATSRSSTVRYPPPTGPPPRGALRRCTRRWHVGAGSTAGSSFRRN